MPALILPEEAHPTCAPPVAVSSPFDEGVWNAWIAKGLKRDRRKSAEHIRVGQWFVVVALMAAAAFLPSLQPFELATRSILTAFSLLTMFQAFREARYALSAVFGLLAVLFNPMAQIFAFTNSWQRAAIALSSVVLAFSGRKRGVKPQ